MIEVAVVQAEVASTLEEGLARTRTLTSDAAAQGARLVVFPETWLPGYPAWLDVCRDVSLWDHAPTKAVFARYRAESVEVGGAAGQVLADIARASDVTLVIGISERVSAGPGYGTLYNSLLTYGPTGVLLNHHRKLMPTYTERLVWGHGDTAGLRAVDTPAGRVGGLVCWEHWMPLSRQALHGSGEDVHVAVWPTVQERHQIARRSRRVTTGRCQNRDVRLRRGRWEFSRVTIARVVSAHLGGRRPRFASRCRGGPVIIRLEEDDHRHATLVAGAPRCRGHAAYERADDPQRRVEQHRERHALLERA